MFFLNPDYKMQLENFLSHNQQLLLDDELFYRIGITYFSIAIFATKVIKIKNIAHITPSIIRKTQQFNIQSSGLKLVKLSYLVSSVDQKDICFHTFCLMLTY